MTTKTVCQLDEAGQFIGVTQADESPLEPGVWLLPAGAVDAEPPEIAAGHLARWNGEGFDVEVIPVAGPEPEPVPIALTQFERDQLRYMKRAQVQADLMSWMAADNMSRVRSGVWTVPQLMALMDDPAIKAAQTYMATLSYELAAQAIATATTPLLTPEIKSAWVAKLQAHFFLDPVVVLEPEPEPVDPVVVPEPVDPVVVPEPVDPVVVPEPVDPAPVVDGVEVLADEGPAL